MSVWNRILLPSFGLQIAYYSQRWLPYSSAKAGEGEKIISQENWRGSEMETKERYETQRVKSGKICQQFKQNWTK